MAKRAARDFGSPKNGGHRTKRVKTTPSVASPQTYFLRLRSGQIVRHPLIFGAGTMEVDPLARFELAPLDPMDRYFDANGMVVVPASSESTEASVVPIISSSELTSTPPSQASNRPPWSASSQASTRPPWSDPSSRPETASTERSPGSSCAPSTLQRPQPSRASRALWSQSPTPVSDTVHSDGTSTPVASEARCCPRGRAGLTTSSPFACLLEEAHGTHIPVDDERVRSLEAPTWFAEVWESDGYDSDAIGLLVAGHHSRQRLSTIAADSPGPMLKASSGRLAPLGWEFESWPHDVRRIHEQYNPRPWSFPPVSLGEREGAGCGCEFCCCAALCLNARESRFCSQRNCAFGGVCGNALQEHAALALARNCSSGMRGVVATSTIPAGEVIGEYLGQIQLLGPPCLNGPLNEGYRMHLKTRSTGRKHLGIDALDMGGKRRFLNHARNPCARFHEVQTGRQLTVVAVTVREVLAGEEVTVSYGNHLWFVCRCGWSGCQHRDIQHLPDIPAFETK